MTESPKGSHSRRAFVNMLTLAGGHAGSTIILLAMTPYFYGVLGASKYGLLTLFFSLVQYAAVVDFGLGPALVKYVAEDHTLEKRDGIRTMMTFASLFYIGVAALVMPLLFVFGHQIVDVIKMPAELRSQAFPLLIGIAAYFFIAQQGFTLHGLLSGLGRIDISAIVRASGLMFYVFGTFFALRLGFGLRGMVIISFLSTVGAMPVLYYFARKELGHVYCWPTRLTWPPIRRLFVTGGWIQVSTIMSLLYSQTNGIVIGIAVNVAAVALYDLAGRLSRGIRALSFYINGSLFPAISALEARSGTGAILKVLVDASRYVSAVSFCASGFLIAAAPIIFSAWLGSRAQSQLVILVGLLIVLCLTATIENCIGVPLMMLRAIGLPKLETVYTITVAVTNVLLTIFLVRRFGVLGVAAGTMVGSLLGSILFLFNFSRIYKVSLIESFGKPIAKLLAITAVSAGATWFVARLLMRGGVPSRPMAFADLAIVGSLYGILFLGLIGITGFLRTADLAFIKRIIPSRFAAPVDRRLVRFLFAGR